MSSFLSCQKSVIPRFVIGRRDCKPRSSTRFPIGSTDWTPPTKTVRVWAVRSASENTRNRSNLSLPGVTHRMESRDEDMGWCSIGLFTLRAHGTVAKGLLISTISRSFSAGDQQDDLF